MNPMFWNHWENAIDIIGILDENEVAMTTQIYNLITHQKLDTNQIGHHYNATIEPSETPFPQKFAITPALN